MPKNLLFSKADIADAWGGNTNFFNICVWGKEITHMFKK